MGKRKENSSTITSPRDNPHKEGDGLAKEAWYKNEFIDKIGGGSPHSDLWRYKEPKKNLSSPDLKKRTWKEPKKRNPHYIFHLTYRIFKSIFHKFIL